MEHILSITEKGMSNVIGERSEPLSTVFNDQPRDILYIYYIPPQLTVHFSMTHSMRYQPILHTLYYTLHTEHAYCLSYRFLNNVVITTVIEMVEMVEILDGRLGKRSVEQVRYVINNLLHLVIVKYGDISLVLCISTRTLYFHSPAARDNTVATCEISPHNNYTLTRVISLFNIDGGVRRF